ncbi:hypothetical protein PAPYR_4385 [Paratrimastix pyriformis]|uniref:DUF4209 domain-containing protein n=1 Tax=Paratrimastix pyriformis TaxID=342808 RepID=A0ABQ8ULD7_9EUKA|nr:hypothetical protein PAPYR_4385 [Paratrimastix pyriformis]
MQHLHPHLCERLSPHPGAEGRIQDFISGNFVAAQYLDEKIQKWEDITLIYSAALECERFLSSMQLEEFNSRYGSLLPFFSEPATISKAFEFYKHGEELVALHYLFPVLDFTLGDLFQFLWYRLRPRPSPSPDAKKTRAPTPPPSAPEPNGLLNELLGTPEMRSLGMGGLFGLLSALLVNPGSLDLRNLILHGFLPDQAATGTLRPYCALLLMGLVSIPGHRPDLVAMPHRPLHEVDPLPDPSWLAQFGPMPAGPAEPVPEPLERLAGPDRARCLRKCWDLARRGETGASLLLLLPQLEAILRARYVAVNDLDRGLLQAAPGQYYVIITTILAPVLLPPCTPYCVDLFDHIQTLTARAGRDPETAAGDPQQPERPQKQLPPTAVGSCGDEAPAPTAVRYNRLITAGLSGTAVGLLYDLFFHRDGLKLRELLHGRCLLLTRQAPGPAPATASTLHQAWQCVWLVLWDLAGVLPQLRADPSAPLVEYRPQCSPVALVAQALDTLRARMATVAQASAQWAATLARIGAAESPATTPTPATPTHATPTPATPSPSTEAPDDATPPESSPLRTPFPGGNQLVFPRTTHTIKTSIVQASRAVVVVCEHILSYGESLQSKLVARKAHTQQRKQFAILTSHSVPLVDLWGRLLAPAGPSLAALWTLQVYRDGDPAPERLETIVRKAVNLVGIFQKAQRECERHNWCEVMALSLQAAQQCAFLQGALRTAYSSNLTKPDQNSKL